MEATLILENTAKNTKDFEYIRKEIFNILDNIEIDIRQLSGLNYILKASFKKNEDMPKRNCGVVGCLETEIEKLKEMNNDIKMFFVTATDKEFEELKNSGSSFFSDLKERLNIIKSVLILFHDTLKNKVNSETESFFEKYYYFLKAMVEQSQNLSEEVEDLMNFCDCIKEEGSEAIHG